MNENLINTLFKIHTCAGIKNLHIIQLGVYTGKSHHNGESDNEKLVISIVTKVTLGMRKMLISQKY